MRLARNQVNCTQIVRNKLARKSEYTPSDDDDDDNRLFFVCFIFKKSWQCSFVALFVCLCISLYLFCQFSLSRRRLDISQVIDSMNLSHFEWTLKNQSNDWLSAYCGCVIIRVRIGNLIESFYTVWLKRVHQHTRSHTKREREQREQQRKP